MNVGILGSGEVGQALGNGFVSRGHAVKLGAREASNAKTAAWTAKHPGKGSAGTFRDAASFGETLVIATHWDGTENALSLAGHENFAGKVVLDVTNPLVVEPGKPPRLALGHTDSGGEQVQRWLPGARVVKVFNSVGNAYMVDPKFPGGPPTMFLCGNDAAARGAVADVCRAFGWETADLGGIEGARLLEPLCILWVQYGALTGRWNHAFKLLRG
jgi:predicted dinucleotide-binding enzyme